LAHSGRLLVRAGRLLERADRGVELGRARGLGAQAARAAHGLVAGEDRRGLPGPAGRLGVDGERVALLDAGAQRRAPVERARDLEILVRGHVAHAEVHLGTELLNVLGADLVAQREELHPVMARVVERERPQALVGVDLRDVPVRQLLGIGGPTSRSDVARPTGPHRCAMGPDP